MKNSLNYYLWAGLILCSFTFLSCSKEDDQPDNKNPIVGIWTYNAYNLDVKVNGKEMMLFLTQDMGYSPIMAQAASAIAIDTYLNPSRFPGSTMQFMENGTYTLSEGNGNTVTGTYQLTDNNTKLVLVSEGETVNCTLKDLSNNRLVFSYTEMLQGDFTQNGVNENVEMDIEFTFIK